jgi:DNA-binding transcriptional MerR regulator
MSARQLIRRARDIGVELSLIAGVVKVRGNRQVVELMLASLREHRLELITALQRQLISADQVDWLALDSAYWLHHRGCLACEAADQGYGLRCGTGSTLWRAPSD